VGIKDRFDTSGELDSILETYGLTAHNVGAQAELVLTVPPHPYRENAPPKEI